MWHLRMAHQQESFLPFSSEPHGPSYSLQNRVAPYLLQNLVVLPMAATPRFKSQCPSSFAAPFLTPPTVSYTCQHPRILPAQRAAIVSLGRCGPMAWSQSSPSSPTGPVTRGSCFPVHLRWKSLPCPWFKAGPQLFNISMKPVKGCRHVQ